MSKLDAIKCETSYLGNLLVTHLLVIAVTVLWAVSNDQKITDGFMWVILIFIISLVVSSHFIHKKVISLLRNDELWKE